ncbi:MAG: heparinase II/III family protein [bacterium]
MKRLLLAMLLLPGALLRADGAGSTEHPFLLIDRAGLDRLSQSGLPHIKNFCRQVTNQADVLLKQDLSIPEQGGGWYFDLYCANEGAYLQRVAPSRFVCPNEHKTNENKKAEAAWRSTQHDIAAHGAQTLGLAYGLTGKKAYAEKAAWILLKYADLYNGYKRHDRWGRTGFLAFMGGKRYAQALDEAVNLIPCAWSYDLIQPSGVLTPAQAKHVEKDFFEAAVKELQVPTFQQDNNHQTWINAAIASVGFCLGDEALIKESIEGKYGFKYQMNRCVTADGLWHEGTMAYQRYAMEPLVIHARMAAQAGMKLSGDSRLRSLFDGPLIAAFPDGSYPINNDSDPYRLSGMADLYEWAYAVWGDPRYAAVAAQGNRQGWLAFLAGVPELPAGGSPVVTGSRNLPGIGQLFLNGKPGVAAACLMMKYGIHGGDHGHPDKLGIVLQAWGEDRFVDPGRITYSVPEYKSWCKQSVAHNTMVVDQKSQRPAEGRCLWFAEGTGFQAACARVDDAYAGVTMDRMVAFTDRYILDCFRTVSDDAHTYDLSLHVRGGMPATNRFTPCEQGLGRDQGYQHLDNVMRCDGSAVASLTWPVRGQGAITLTAPYGEKEADAWFIGNGIGTHLGDKVPFLIRRKVAKAAVWCAVYELHAPGIGAVKRVTSEGRAEAGQLKVSVHGEGWTDKWTIPWLAVTNAAGGMPVSADLIPGLKVRL